MRCWMCRRDGEEVLDAIRALPDFEILTASGKLRHSADCPVCREFSQEFSQPSTLRDFLAARKKWAKKENKSCEHIEGNLANWPQSLVTTVTRWADDVQYAQSWMSGNLAICRICALLIKKHG